MWISDSWQDFEVLDCSRGEKLERWGKYTLVRPDPQAIWDTPRTDPRWRWLPDDSTLADPVIDLSVLVGHRQVTDLHLVNLAASAGLRLVTFDAGIAAALAKADRRHVLVLPQ